MSLGMIGRIAAVHVTKLLAPILKSRSHSSTASSGAICLHPALQRKDVDLPPCQDMKALIRAAYKPVHRKIRPVDCAPSDGTTPAGRADWFEVEFVTTEFEDGRAYQGWLVPRVKTAFPRGERLTPDRAKVVRETLVDMTEAEADMLLTMLENREPALAWDWTHCGRVKDIVAPPQEIRTVPHTAWQAASIPIPKALEPVVVNMLRDRLKRGTIEEGYGPYRNPWFLVKKKDSDYRLINSATKLNAVTIRDAMVAPGADEYAADLAMGQRVTLLDIFSGYDQAPLAETSRDLTTFVTIIGLFRMCTLP